MLEPEEVFSMADVARGYEEHQEFWKPAVAPRADSEAAAAPVCPHCGADLISESRFCHGCGSGRLDLAGSAGHRFFPAWLDFAFLRDALGQTTPSLVALVLGCASIIAAVVTGFAFTVTTLLDWQAVQLWRIEWLLAAIALFTAGRLLKKT